MDNRPTPQDIARDAQRIRELGGVTKVAELLGLTNHGPQRVGNWMRRGIPATVKVARPDLFLTELQPTSVEQAA